MRRRIASVLLAFTPLSALAQYPPVVTRSRLDPARDVNFHAILLPDTVYVGQQATYQIGVFLNQNVRQRLRRNPEFVPPETRSLLVYDLPDAKSPLVGSVDGRSYEVHVFQRAFFALSPGRYEVPPAKLTYALPQSASFFSREETHALRSEALSLVVLPVPAAGRPDDWAGAVGEWRARLRVDSSSGRVGNPIVVTIRIEGRGNVTLLPRPRLRIAWGSVVAADERVELDSTPTTLRGAKEFDWLLTPRQPGRRVIPSQRVAYFNPWSRRYELAFSPAVTVAVGEGDALAADSTVDAAPPLADTPPATGQLAIRSSMGSAATVSWLRAPWFVALIALAPLPALIGAFRHRRRRPRPAPSKARQLRDAAGTSAASPETLRRLTHDALRERLAFDAGLALANGALVSAMRHEGVTDATATRVEHALRQLDAATFGAAAGHAPSASELSALITAVDAEARRARRPQSHATLGLLLLLALAAASPLLARQGDSVERSWALGQTAYAGRDFERAERHFLDVARLRSDHPDVWANVGTAAWMAADTARAVQGWQRALRRSPLDLEMRSRLALVRAVQDRGAARVPPVPVQLPPLLLALVWGAGWWLIARRAWAGRTIVRPALLLLVGGAAIAAGAAFLDRAQRATHLAVVVRPEPLRSIPALGADQGPAPLTGEVAVVVERRGAWTHVRLDGQRQGWIAEELLLPLGDD